MGKLLDRTIIKDMLGATGYAFSAISGALLRAGEMAIFYFVIAKLSPTDGDLVNLIAVLLGAGVAAGLLGSRREWEYSECAGCAGCQHRYSCACPLGE